MASYTKPPTWRPSKVAPPKKLKYRIPRMPSASARKQSSFEGLAPYAAPSVAQVSAPIPLWMLPPTNWKRPTAFPRLDEAEIVGVDVESYDPDLRSRGKGPGYIRGNAYIIGVAINARWANRERFNGYYPIRHDAGADQNFDPEHIFDYCRDNLQKTEHVPKVGANLPYDLEALWIDGKVEVRGPLWDIQNAEGILDEESALVTNLAHRGFRLEKLGLKYCGIGKEEDALKVLGNIDIKKRMRELPPHAVGEYAEGDVELSLAVFDKQIREIESQNLEEIWQLECDILPYLMKMRYHGVRVDPERAELVKAALEKEHKEMLDELMEMAGRAIDPDKKEDLLVLCEKAHVTPLYTEKGNPSFTKGWLSSQTHPAFKKVTDCRSIEKMYRDFVQGVIIDENINGRIHCQFHQLKRNAGVGAGSDDGDSDEAGTRSGRFSSTNPNLQQIPKRSKRFGPLIRSMFLPDQGGEWASGDYNSQEFRLLIHYAGMAANMGNLSPAATKAAQAMVAEYIAVPETDYHQKVADMTELERDIAKPLNLMLVYGAGQRKVAVTTGWITTDQYKDRNFRIPPSVRAFFDSYHDGVPFVSELLALTDKKAAERGYVMTIGGRKRHFDLWVPSRQRNYEGYAAPIPLPRELALEMWPTEPLVRADTRKALNSVIQGSAADMGKVALRTLGRLNLIPQLMVHDEFNRTVYEPAQAKTMHEAMVHAYELLVPVLVDFRVGPNWSDASKNRAHEIGLPVTFSAKEKQEMEAKKGF